MYAILCKGYGFILPVKKYKKTNNNKKIKKYVRPIPIHISYGVFGLKMCYSTLCISLSYIFHTGPLQRIMFLSWRLSSKIIERHSREGF